MQAILYIRKRYFTIKKATLGRINTMLNGSDDAKIFCQHYNGIISTKGTPHILVDYSYPGVVAPESGVNNETKEIVLNIAPEAIGDFNFQNNTLLFSATFDSINSEIIIPFAAIKKIYSYELGAGIIFIHEE